MRRIFTFISVAVFTVASVAQTVSWSSSNLTGESDVLNDGTLVEAVNFAGGDDVALETTTLNSVVFTGLVSGAATGNAFASPSSTHFSATSQNVVPATVDQYKLEADADDAHHDGLAAYDVLLSRFLWNGGMATITLKGLEVGSTYKVQMFMGDTRVSQDTSYIMINPNEDFTSGDYGSKSTTHFTNNNGLSMVGEFTATADTLSYVVSKIDNAGVGNGTHLNAMQLRKYTEASLQAVAAKQMRAYYAGNNSLVVNLTQGTVNMYTISGQLIKTVDVVGSKRIDTSRLSAGVYIIRSENEAQKVMIN